MPISGAGMLTAGNFANKVASGGMSALTGGLSGILGAMAPGIPQLLTGIIGGLFGKSPTSRYKSMSKAQIENIQKYMKPTTEYYNFAQNAPAKDAAYNSAITNMMSKYGL